jgi:hypothetical protein
MNDKIIEKFDQFQIADLDDDMVGMCKSLVDWMIEIQTQVDSSKLPEPEAPFNFYKMDPHQPRMELRKNYRKFLAHAVKYQKEEDEEVKLINLYVAIQAGTYLYHMPTEKMVARSKEPTEITREESQEMLLNDNMSPNWLKEPSGKDFTAIML